ncbi:MAG: response regulator transcription factor [Chloroflexi bacterium]|nr:response regulator transcription factor [Chloroflexota bacterium]
MTITIFLADDHTVLRDSLRFLLDAQPDFQVIGVANNGRDAAQQIERLRPNVAILDISMPHMNGIQVTERIYRVCPVTRVIILSMHRTPEHITQALQAGARGYLLKESASDEVIEAISIVHAEKRYLSQSISDMVLDYYVDLHRGETDPDPLESLTQREREVLQLLVEGKSSAEIGNFVSLSPRTVDTYRSRIMQKLSIPHLPGLVRFAIQCGLISLE